MAKLVRKPEAYGLDFEPIPNKPYFARVEVGGQIDLRVASAILNISDEEMHALNPAFNRWATDPEGPFHLLVPASSARAFAETVAGLTPDQRLPVEHHVLEPKETLAGIAKERNLPIAVVQQLNGSAKFEAKFGDDILLPSTSVIAPLRAGLVIEGETDKLGHPIKQATGKQQAHHVIRRGDVPVSVAQQHLVEATNSSQHGKSSQQSGQEASAKTNTATTKRPDARVASSRYENESNTSRFTKAGNAKIARREIRYQIKRGDTIAAISKKFSVRPDQIWAWNRIGKALSVGETIIIKLPAPAASDFRG
jgi:membrane-bound lytic murein transglycosylase D